MARMSNEHNEITGRICDDIVNKAEQIWFIFSSTGVFVVAVLNSAKKNITFSKCRILYLGKRSSKKKSGKNRKITHKLRNRPTKEGWQGKWVACFPKCQTYFFLASKSLSQKKIISLRQKFLKIFQIPQFQNQLLKTFFNIYYHTST